MKKIRLEFQYDGALARLFLDDGKGNVLDHVMMEDLMEALVSLREKSDIKLILLEGAGKHFSFGASVEEHQKEFAATMLRSFHQLFYLARDLSMPMLAKVSGQCLGGGMELALMCQFIFADRSARFGQPEIVLGVFPPPASVILPEKIGLAKAEELLLTGKTVTAEEASALGLVNAVFDDRESLEQGVITFFEEHLLPKSASSLRFAVRAARAKFNHLLANFLPAVEQMYVSNLMNTHDANEGIASFLEKRKPVWQNN